MKKAFFVMVCLAAALNGCSDNGQNLGCVDDADCPQGQQCIAGNCQLPGDPGPKTCQTINDCGIGEDCKNGICVPFSFEPDAGGEDGGDPGGDPGSDPGSDPGADPVTDRDTTNYSALNFRVAVSRGGTSGPATQCVLDVHPEANQGPVLPILSLPGGYTLSGTVTSGPGTDVTVLHQYPECVPAPVKADGGGNFTFYLPQGSHTLQAKMAGRLVAYDTVSLNGNTSRTLTFPTGTDITGGSLRDGTVDLNNWTVYAHYRTGALAGKLAHPGVITGAVPNPIGVFVIPLPEGATYDLLGYPPANEPYPLQVLYTDVNPSDPQDWDLGPQGVRGGVIFSGQVTVGGNGSPGASIDLKNYVDPRLAYHADSITNGNFQALVRPDFFSVDVMPSAAAFAQGACGYMHPQYDLNQPRNVTIELVTGNRVVFSGRIQDTQGSGIQGANVRLTLIPPNVVEQDFSICDPAPVQTDANGSFNITCNLLP